MKLLTRLAKGSELVLNTSLATRLGCENFVRAYVRFGSRVCEASVSVSPELSAEEICFSTGAVQELLLPLCMDMEIRRERNELILGPFMGILAAHERKKLLSRLASYTNYVYDYSLLHGAAAVFSLDMVNTADNTINGYLYNPQADVWEPAVYPIPCAILKLIGVKRPWRLYFEQQTQNRMFNDQLFSKWKAYSLLEKDMALQPYLPCTLLYTNPGDVKSMLELYGSVYVKPVFGSQGREIFCIRQRGNFYEAQKSDSKQPTLLHSDAELNQMLRTCLKQEDYAVQQTLHLLTINGNTLDFRCVTLRGADGNTKVLDIIARCGQSGSIVNNVSAGGFAQAGYEALLQTGAMTPQQAGAMLLHMEQVCHAIGHCLENSGYLCGNLGIDLAIDKDLRLWIIEVNNKNPSHTIALNAGNALSFYTIRRTSLLYAKYLCGFETEEPV